MGLNMSKRTKILQLALRPLVLREFTTFDKKITYLNKFSPCTRHGQKLTSTEKTKFLQNEYLLVILRAKGELVVHSEFNKQRKGVKLN